MDGTETIDGLPVFKKKNATDDGLPILKKKASSSDSSINSESSGGATPSTSSRTDYKYRWDEIKDTPLGVLPAANTVSRTPVPDTRKDIGVSGKRLNLSQDPSVMDIASSEADVTGVGEASKIIPNSITPVTVSKARADDHNPLLTNYVQRKREEALVTNKPDYVEQHFSQMVNGAKEFLKSGGQLVGSSIGMEKPQTWGEAAGSALGVIKGAADMVFGGLSFTPAGALFNVGAEALPENVSNFLFAPAHSIAEIAGYHPKEGSLAEKAISVGDIVGSIAVMHGIAKVPEGIKGKIKDQRQAEEVRTILNNATEQDLHKALEEHGYVPANDGAIKSSFLKRSATLKQQSGDMQGAIKDLDAAISITDQAPALKNLWEEKATIFNKLMQDKSLADKYVEIIKGENDVNHELYDQDFFIEKYIESHNEAKKYDKLSKPIQEEVIPVVDEKRNEFIKKHLEDISDSERVPGIDYNAYFGNLYDRKSVQKPLTTEKNAGGEQVAGAAAEAGKQPDAGGRGDTVIGENIEKGPEPGGPGVLPEGVGASQPAAVAAAGAQPIKLNIESKVLSEAHEKKDIDFAHEIIDEGWFHSTGNVYERRPDLGLSTEEVTKGIRDIKADKNSAPALKIIEALKSVNEKGEMPMLQGSGGHTERFGMPLDEVRAQNIEVPREITEEQAREAEKIKVSDTVLSEGITNENFDDFVKENDWIYSPEEIQQIKTYLHESKKQTGDIPAGAAAEGKSPELEQLSKSQAAGEQQAAGAGKQSGGTEGIESEAAATQKSYENIAGLTPSSRPGRIPVAPVIDGHVKDISKIIFDVTKETKQRLFYANPGSGRRSALGTYSPGSTAVKIKFNGDLDVTAHELGHSIDDHFGVLSDLQKTPNLPVEMELTKFSPFGSKPPTGHSNPRSYRDAEGFAEFLRALIVNPEKTKSEAPNLYALYDSKVHPDYKKAVDNFSNDIRAWAGSSGRDMVLSNVEWKPEDKKGVIGQILSKSEANNMFSVTWADKLAANFVNPMRAFEKANEYAKGLKEIDEQLPENDPSLLARTLLGVDGKVSEILDSGMIDAKLNVLKDANGKEKNLKWLLEPLDNTDMASIEKDAKDVVSYMVAERTVELSKKFDRENVLSGIGGGIFKDADVAKKALDEFNTRNPEEVARIKDAAGRYREMADDVLKYMVDKGRLSKENYDQIKKDNTQYVAMQRVIETEPGREIEVYNSGGGNLGSKTDVVQTIKGSTKKIKNPYTSLIDLIYRGVKESDRNESLLAFRNMLVPERKDMYDGTPVRLADIGTRVKAGDKETVTIFVDGKPEYWKFQTDVYKALKGLDSDGYKLPGVVTALPRMLRWTVTNFPVFAMRNVVRDFQDRIIKSNENGWNNAFGIKDMVGNKEHWKEVARSGGLNAGYYMKDKVHYYGLMEQAMKDMAKNKNSIIADPSRLKAGWEGYKSILQKSETVNRVAEYRAGFRNAKSKGMDDYNAKLYAGLKSRDLLDFALMGHWMKVVNQMIPFSNAAIQGTRSALVRAKENPLGFGSRMVAFSVIPSIANWLVNNKDEESKKQYNELPDYQRDLFYNFKIGDNKWVSIPKPYELSLMGSAVDRGMSYYAGDKDAFKGYAGTVAKSTLPFDDASFAGGFQSVVEGISNYDFFRGKNIVPPHEDALDLALRNTERSSRLGKAVQEIAGIDARKADHFINGSFSYFGKTATELSDIGKEDDANPFTLSDLGFFKQSPAYNGKSVQEFMKVAKEGNFTGTVPYRKFSNLVKQYFNAGTDEEKDKMAKILNGYAKSTLPLMKKSLNETIKQKAK